MVLFYILHCICLFFCRLVHFIVAGVLGEYLYHMTGSDRCNIVQQNHLWTLN